jgi:hypothetical protein
MNRKVLAITFLLASGIFGCAKPQPPQPNATAPDLIPVPDPRPGFGFNVTEQIPGDGLGLVITIKNQGPVDAPSSTTTVRFQGAGGFFPLDVPTFGLSAGTSVTLHVPFPQACFQPDCGFVIEVDSKSQVDESDENNNKGTGHIVG